MDFTVAVCANKDGFVSFFENPFPASVIDQGNLFVLAAFMMEFKCPYALAITAKLAFPSLEPNQFFLVFPSPFTYIFCHFLLVLP